MKWPKDGAEKHAPRDVIIVTLLAFVFVLLCVMVVLPLMVGGCLP